MVILETRLGILLYAFQYGLDFCYALPKKDKLQPKFERMSVYVRSGNRDSSKGNISWLRVDRKETTVYVYIYLYIT